MKRKKIKIKISNDKLSLFGNGQIHICKETKPISTIFTLDMPKY